MERICLARRAMACRFELVLEGDDPARLRAAGEEALREIERIEDRLSFYRPASELSRLNARAADGPVRVSAPLFGLLRTARRLHDETGGAFDPTVGPLMRAWGFTRGTGRLPDPAALAAARRCTGMAHVALDADARTVRFARPGVQLDFGGIGKGFAVDEAVAVLRESGVRNALLHGGTSTVAALGAPAEADAWAVAVAAPGEGEASLAVVRLRDAVLSVSAPHGKAFEAEGRVYGHVLDPRRGAPAEGAALAATVTETATEGDALSTALLVLGPDARSLTARYRGRMQALVALHDGTVLAEGFPPRLGPTAVPARLTA
ncbi:MAG: FAD:protein FMN transferase [Rhodothermales bacterium]|nr:FAD:protein FMN transferase [Rhodothermales bacterium]